MSKSKTATTKTQVAETKVNEVSKISFAEFSDRLSKVELKEKKKKERLYIYPETFTEKMINESEGKAFRSKQRNKIKTFANNIPLFAKHNRIEDLQKEIKSFIAYYKEVYRINDFSVNSISQKADEKTDDIKLMLDIVKKVQSAK